MTHLHRAVYGPVGLAVALTAVLPGTLWAQGGGGEAGSGLFDINTGLVLWTAIVFLLLLAVLWKWAWGPILSLVEAREDRIRGALEESAEKREEAQRLFEEQKAELAQARRKAQKIIAEGKEAGEKVKRDIEEKAREEGQALLERARNEIEREKDQALNELRRESVDLALAAAARLLGRELDEERDRELVMDYLEGVAKATSGDEEPGEGVRA